MKEKKTILWQDNAVTLARYDITAIEKNILYMVMEQVRKDDKVGKIYSVSEYLIMKYTQKEIESKLFKEAAKKLLLRYIEYTLPNGNLAQTALIASAEHLKNTGIINITISEIMLRFYIDLKEKFTTFQLETALSISGKYAKRFYEICSMYKNMKNKTFVLNVIYLKKMIGAINENGKDSYPSFTYFKESVILPAQRELEDKADVCFNFETIEGKQMGKGRRPIEAIKFTVLVKNPNSAEEFALFSEIQQEMIEKLIERLKLRRDQAITVVEKYSREEINKMCYDMSLQKPKIRNIGAYAAKTFGLS